ncbi:BAG family molecular chaperone regulator [Grimontia hollisae]|uniref:BAG family molecular chaperone regulator n=1 Tax=Grimontia hollisae TaxID=673 RepID=UPI00165D8057|nr:BAG family molecular chaperone regulator [Grimontia hollisae]
MDCSYEIIGICLTHASGQQGTAFFGFTEFIGAFALLAIVFTIADVQYRFRVSVSPLPLPRITFWAIGVIGFGTLLTDLWVAHRWPVVYVPHLTYEVIQGLFATGFLSVSMAWLYFAFVKPPIFSKWNAKKYGQVVFSYLLRGSDSELPVIATEVGRSADSLIEIFANHRTGFHEQRKKQERGEKTIPNPGNYASDIMWMIGNRKFCRHVVAASPGTAIRLFQAAANNNVYDAPIGQFAKNISAEAIKNPDSNLYHEDSRYQSGLFGDLKPFTQAIFGTYELVEGLGKKFHSSPLDVDYELTRDWTSSQLEAYARAVLTTYADMLNKKKWYEHSYSLNRAFEIFKRSCWDIYKLDGVEDGDPDIRERLRVCVRFVSDLMKLLEKYEKEIVVERLKPAEKHIHRDIYDHVAELMSEIIYNASGITKPWWPCWNIQHNIVWSEFFDGFRESKSQKIIAHKLRRLIYDEVIEFDKYEDLKSFRAARYLGISLNCMGFKFSGGSRRDRNTEPLKKVILEWVKKNYVYLHDNHPTVAEACLVGSITYDAENMQLVKTYASPADRDPNRDIFSLSK